MADNLTIKDGNGAAAVLATTDTAGVHTPKHIVSSSALPTGAATEAKQDALKASTDFAAPAKGIIVVTPSDSVDLTSVSRGIFVGTGGNISLICGGTTGLFKNVASGTTLPVCASRVRATGTTATDLIALL